MQYVYGICCVYGSIGKYVKVMECISRSMLCIWNVYRGLCCVYGMYMECISRSMLCIWKYIKVMECI